MKNLLKMLFRRNKNYSPITKDFGEIHLKYRVSEEAIKLRMEFSRAFIYNGTAVYFKNN